MESTTIHFVRHGHVQNDNQIYYGRLLGFPLSDTGRDQAARTREAFREKKIAAIYSSPQLRARETAQILSEPPGSALVSITGLLDEVSSHFDGCPITEIEKLDWYIYDHNLPGDEHPEEILARMQQFIQAVRVGHFGQQVVAVTHGDPIAFLILHLKGIVFNAGNKRSLYMESLHPCSITTLTFRALQSDEIPQLDGPVNPSESKQTINAFE